LALGEPWGLETGEEPGLELGVLATAFSVGEPVGLLLPVGPLPWVGGPVGALPKLCVGDPVGALLKLCVGDPVVPPLKLCVGDPVDPPPVGVAAAFAPAPGPPGPGGMVAPATVLIPTMAPPSMPARPTITPARRRALIPITFRLPSLCRGCPPGVWAHTGGDRVTQRIARMHRSCSG
jgi:hypothetical protein